MGVVAGAAFSAAEDRVPVRFLELSRRIPVAAHADGCLGLAEQGRKARGVAPVAIRALPVPDRRMGGRAGLGLGMARAAEFVRRRRHLTAGVARRAVARSDRSVDRVEQQGLRGRGVWVVAAETRGPRGDDALVGVSQGGRAGRVAPGAEFSRYPAEEAVLRRAVGDVAAVTTLPGGFVDLLLFHSPPEACVADQAKVPLVAFEEIRRARGVRIVARPAGTYVQRGVDRRGGELAARFLMTTETQPAGVILQSQLVTEAVALVAFLTVPLAKRRMSELFLFPRLIPLVVALDAGLGRRRRHPQQDRVHQDQKHGGAPSGYDRVTIAYHPRGRQEGTKYGTSLYRETC